MARLFGTDGVRGRANGDLTARLALDLSVSAARVLGEAGELTGSEPGRRSVAVVGRDTRVSGQFLESAVVAGLASAGVDVVLLDVLPTPGVAHLTNALGADLGVMISASHNPMPDNGIKFFARGGRKLDDVLEDAIEARLGQPWSAPTGGGVGRVTRHLGAAEEYAAHLLATRGTSLAGITVVLDCAHGAASVVGPAVLRAAGAELITICAEPDGLNINDGCGSTHLEPLREAVLEHRADVGFALDGDADRVLAVDATGEVVDGDQLLAVLAVAMRDQGRLHADSVVVTVMSNLGFGHAMDQAGIGVLRTSVGDRYVLEEMGRTGHNLGGEQSGHVIMSDHATTGDGLLAALQVLDRMALTRCSIADLAGVMGRLPQVMLNVAGVDRARTDDAELLAAVAEEETGLGETGRILLRPSGTEPLVRVMVEAPTHEQAGAVAERLAAVVRRRITL